MLNFKFSGTGVAVITPFNADKSIDWNFLEKQINYLINNKIEYLVVLGTTSEASTMSDDEKRKLVDFFIEKVNKKVPIVIGMAGNDTRKIANKIKSYDLTGIDAILSVSPYYNKPQQDGIYLHYKALAEVSSLPIILYNVPGRTASNISADTTLRLANDYKNIIAIKEASGDLMQSMKIIKNKPAHFEVISGDDALSLPLIALGAKGVISVIANSLPLQYSDLIRFALKGDFENANELQYRMLNLFNLIFEEGNPAGVKAAMAYQNLLEEHLRLPLIPVSNNLKNRIIEEIKKFQ